MSDFIVSARKYRPTSFDEVVGQISITSTLKNAIKNNQLAQSFLFCGPRGIGKTSCARILAKTINCENVSDKIEACNECVSCQSFNENSSFNVHELDAASNNSVDDIRRLVEQVRFAPQVGNYNIYIIDEVHMLSSQAFNAFLKTLEEPPAHAKFILATTEKNKIIPTILSRCQIFDFKRVGVTDITNHLTFVAEKEGVSAEPEALNLIAQKSDGAMRDSLSLFDRLVSFSENKLTYQGVIDHLNILDYDYYSKVTSYLLDNDINMLLIIFNEILDNGFDGNHFINGLAEHIRDLLVSKDPSTIPLLEKGESLSAKYLEQSKLCDVSFLIKALELSNECDVKYATSNNKRLLVELCLMRISSIGFQSDEKKSPKSFVASHTTNRDAKNVGANEDKKKEEIIKVEEPQVEEDEKVIEETVHFKDVKSEVVSSKQSNTLSIHAAFNEDEKKEELDVSVMKNESFSELEMLDVWKQIIFMVKEKGKLNLGIALSAHAPILKDNFEIELPLSNSSQDELIDEEKYMLLDFLKNSLNNDHIKLKTKVVEGEYNDTPYTNKDKFKKMLEKNKHLEKLRIELGLDPDY